MLRRFTRGRYGELDAPHLNALADTSERALYLAKLRGADLQQKYRRLILVETFVARISGANVVTADEKWSYEFAEATLDGDGVWGDLTSGRTHTSEGVEARNMNEVLTTANQEGLALGGLGTLVRRAVPTGRPVVMHVYLDADNDLRLWFDCPNPLAPACA